MIISPPRRAGRPTRAEANAIAQRLLRRAWALFVEGGAARVTFDALAAAECVSKRTIYVRFADKQALLKAMVAHQLDRWRAENVLALHSSFDDPLCAFVDLTTRVMQTSDAAAMARLLRGDDPASGDLGDLPRAAVVEVEQRLAAIIEQVPGRAVGALPGAEAAAAIVALLFGAAVMTSGAGGASLVSMMRCANVLAGRSATAGCEDASLGSPN